MFEWFRTKTSKNDVIEQQVSEIMQTYNDLISQVSILRKTQKSSQDFFYAGKISEGKFIKLNTEFFQAVQLIPLITIEKCKQQLKDVFPEKHLTLTLQTILLTLKEFLAESVTCLEHDLQETVQRQSLSLVLISLEKTARQGTNDHIQDLCQCLINAKDTINPISGKAIISDVLTAVIAKIPTAAALSSLSNPCCDAITQLSPQYQQFVDHALLSSNREMDKNSTYG